MPFIGKWGMDGRIAHECDLNEKNTQVKNFRLPLPSIWTDRRHGWFPKKKTEVSWKKSVLSDGEKTGNSGANESIIVHRSANSSRMNQQ
jgi:hypothetical protein